MPAPFTTPVAISIPFQPNRNPGYGGNPSLITSTDVQNAIEEAIARAIANDRYSLLFSYNGNAGVGRYLEAFPGIDLQSAPIYFPNTTNALLTVSATTAATATCTIGIYDEQTGTPVLLYTITFTSQKRVTNLGSPTLFVIPSGCLLTIKVDSGSINRPHIYFSASTGG